MVLQSCSPWLYKAVHSFVHPSTVFNHDSGVKLLQFLNMLFSSIFTRLFVKIAPSLGGHALSIEALDWCKFYPSSQREGEWKCLTGLRVSVWTGLRGSVWKAWWTMSYRSEGQCLTGLRDRVWQVWGTVSDRSEEQFLTGLRDSVLQVWETVSDMSEGQCLTGLRDSVCKVWGTVSDRSEGQCL